MSLVIDASVAMGWLLSHQSNPMTLAALELVRDRGGLVPPHFALEIGRALRRRERSMVLSPAECDERIADLRALRLEVDPLHPMQALPAVTGLARAQGLRIADAGYLELAMRSNLPLATRDAVLAEAGRRCGVTLFGG